MHRISLLAAMAAICSASASAQSQPEAKPIPGAVKNAGIYHVATGTWTRGVTSSANLGPDTVFDNTVATGYFANMSTSTAGGDFSLFDEGRLPGTTSAVALADRDCYVINGLTFGYCSDQPGPTVGATFNLYESYNPCDLIVTNPAGSQPFTLSGIAVGIGLPGGTATGAIACWTVTLDLAGAGEFTMEAEGGNQFPGHDGSLQTDSFGIEWIFNGVAGNTTGPLLSGDPDWTPSVAGALLHGGTGTYYDGTGLAPCGNTGLDIQDFCAADGMFTPFAPGCYFFGGYLNSNGCGGPQNNPIASYHFQLFSERADAGICVPDVFGFCNPAGVNSSGNAASLTVTPIATGAGYRLDASGGPQIPGSGFGFFVVSDGMNTGVTIGDGMLCLEIPQGRYSPASGGALNSLGRFDTAGNFENLAGTSTTGYGFDLPTQLPTPPGGSISSGSTWYFQLWYRDLNPGATVNFSDGAILNF